MGMVMQEGQSFEGLIKHLRNAFQSGETLSELISDFYSRSQKARETKDTFTDDLQVLARKIIAWKPSFCLEANQQLKAQYAHKLWDPYYVAMAHSALQSSPEEETFTRFWGHLPHHQASMLRSCLEFTDLDPFNFSNIKVPLFENTPNLYILLSTVRIPIPIIC